MVYVWKHSVAVCCMQCTVKITDWNLVHIIINKQSYSLRFVAIKRWWVGWSKVTSLPGGRDSWTGNKLSLDSTIIYWIKFMRDERIIRGEYIRPVCEGTPGLLVCEMELWPPGSSVPTSHSGQMGEGCPLASNQSGLIEWAVAVMRTQVSL